MSYGSIIPDTLETVTAAATSPTTSMAWTLKSISLCAFLFLLAGLAEIFGGWLVWMSIREGKPWWWAVCGSIILVLYGFIPTLQPLDTFGRLYAVYGGIFIALSFVWGSQVDGMKLDKGDVLGSLLCLMGVAIILFWPRDDGEVSKNNLWNSQVAGEEVQGLLRHH